MRYLFWHSTSQGLVLSYSDDEQRMTHCYVGYNLREAVQKFRHDYGLKNKHMKVTKLY